MRLPSLPVTLKSGVGRRILGFFVLAGVLPVLFTAGLAYHEIGRGLEQDVGRTLRMHAKDYGLDLLARLQRTSAAADQIALIVEEDGPQFILEHPYLVNGVEAMWTVDGNDVDEQYFGKPGQVVPLADLAKLPEGMPLPTLVTGINAGADSLVFLRRINDGTPDARVLAIKPAVEQLWEARENLPYSTDFCVHTLAGVALHCSSAMAAGLQGELATPSARTTHELVEWRDGEAGHLAAMWQLFLAGEFNAPALDIVVSQPTSYALRSRADFSRVFIPAFILVLILVGLLSFNMIGKSLIPMRKLITAARQLASGNLLSRVRIQSNDEFESLGGAFNNMAGRLSQQIATLEAMSGIDRLILSGATFEEVAESVVRHIINLSGCKAAGVIARDDDTPHWAKMISFYNDEFVHERMPLPMELGHNWCQPRQVSVQEVSPSVAPYKARFLSYDVSQVVLIPVVLDDDLKGILLLGTASHLNMERDSMKRCVDLAGRFAVALASAEREEALYRQAHYDDLTGLPNRQLLKDRLGQQIVQARRDGSTGALLYLDLDRFKEINDVHGHSIGDVVLQQAAERIVNEVRDSDTVSRLGGDEFVVIMPQVEGESHVRSTATRLLKRIGESFSVHGEDHFVSGSIGIVMFPDDGDSVETLLKNADMAMYSAKEAGRARFEFFSAQLNAESRRKIGLERDLRAAFANGELAVRYQPQMDIASGNIDGAEALLRWDHPVEGPISPAEFVPLAEDSDLIVEIGGYVIEQTCRDLKRILEQGLHPGAVSINVSTRQLREGRFVSDVLEPLQRFDINPAYLQLEVTETTVAQNRDTAIYILRELRERGVRVAIDDFGTGYSSLSYLQQLPFDVIKIDRSFIDRIGAGDPSDNICRTIIRMAHEMGKKAIAEGVETILQFEFLRQNECDFAQGYYYSQPLGFEEFVAFIEKEDFHTQRRKALEVVRPIDFGTK
ncbi:MAG: EAL domain-containing protein [Woeseiaceae bacterium]|nr:EAL domain-containing protein [Woeseiaceae bacterium]